MNQAYMEVYVGGKLKKENLINNFYGLVKLNK